jgi:hypothetical protein
MARVFVDLDGVLADFDNGSHEVLGMSAKDYQELHGAAVMWKKLAATPNFYADLPVIEGAMDMLDEIWQSASLTQILTGLPLGKWAEPQKREWCARHVGAHIPVICCMSRDKWQYATPGDILIDDRASSRLDWEGAGGIFIQHVDAATSLAALHAELGG